ncbi:metallophosphoesterase family protein [Bradyrhizobium sp.]|uniref:metallophosphoesterase family protein n=1 Tax=Bradyrhizobium sp. TaxID=376 RepID=UPI002D1FB34F|nr:metallophosphoesterase [Bradyrhizobium sp.]
MTASTVESDAHSMQQRMLVDPRHGDVEDDAASPGQRSLLAIAGSLLAEISLPKLLFAWTALLLLPAVLLGLTPLLVSAWFSTLSQKLAALTGIGTALALLAIAAVGWIGWRPLLRIAENNFWSLNALAVQPGYAFTREALRHLAERIWRGKLTAPGRARLRSASSVGAGIVLSACAVLIAILAWPATRWTGGWSDLVLLHRIVLPTLANAVLLVSGYLAAASLAWGFADASMSQPVDLTVFDTASPGARRWRVAHLSDIHVVAEQYGFRIESGRAGPCGNRRLERILARLATIHATDPIDHIVISGDMTDAGRAGEWAAFFDAMARHPELVARTVMLPGNHDVNIVDRANPARLDLPFSPNMRLRQIRTLSALAAVQGDRVRVVDAHGKPAATLQDALAPHRDAIVALAEHGGMRRAAALRDLFDGQFPMIVPPEAADGLGIAILNSNAQTHFSFTNALGLVSVEQTHRFEAAIRHYPEARWIVALHHHVVEYPMPAKAFSERIGTALINGSWFVRRLEALAGRAVVMHGHRHVDWIGACGSLKIISAPSPVMNATDDAARHFYIHILAAGPNGQLALLPPRRVDIAGEAEPEVT